MPLIRVKEPVAGVSLYRKNFFINGGFNVQQRAEVAFSDITPRYGKADRWRAVLSSQDPMGCTLTAGDFNGVYSRQALFAAGLQFTSGLVSIQQRIESNNSKYFGDKYITISATLYHDFGNTQPFGIVVSAPNSADNYGGGSTDVHTSTGTEIPNTTPIKISTTFPITPAQSINGLQVSFQPYQYNTFSGKTLGIAEAQLEIGQVVTPWEARTLAEELALCQRYFEKSYNALVNPGTASDFGREQHLASSTVAYAPVVFKKTKRAVPIITVYSSATGAAGFVRNLFSNADVAAAAEATGENKSTIGFLSVDGNTYGFHWTASAEL